MSYCEDSNINKSYIVQTVDSSDIFSACTEIYLTNITPCTGDTININSNLSVIGDISGTTFYGDGSKLSGIITTDNYVTGGVYTATTKSLYFTGTTGFTPFSVDVSALLDDTNNYVTGGTYNPSTDTISLFRNDNVTIDITGVTDTFTTGGTYNQDSGELTLSDNNSNDILINGFFTGVTISNTLFVDENGDDSTGQKGRLDKPFKTLKAAKDSASSGDTIYVHPQTIIYDNSGANGTPYNGNEEDVNLWKDGVKYYFSLGSKIIIKNQTISGTNLSLFKVGATTGETCYVDGYLEYEQIGFGFDNSNGNTNYFTCEDSLNGGCNFYSKTKKLTSYHGELYRIQCYTSDNPIYVFDESDEQVWTWTGQGQTGTGGGYVMLGKVPNANVQFYSKVRKRDFSSSKAYSFYIRENLQNSNIRIDGDYMYTYSNLLYLRQLYCDNIHINIKQIDYYYAYVPFGLTGSIVSTGGDGGTWTLNLNADLNDKQNNSITGLGLFYLQTGNGCVINYNGKINTKTNSGVGRFIVGNNSNNCIVNLDGEIDMMGSGTTSNIILQAYSSGTKVNFNGEIKGNYSFLAHPRIGGEVNIFNSKISSTAEDFKMLDHTDTTTSTFRLDNSKIEGKNDIGTFADGQYLNVLINNSSITNTGSGNTMTNLTNFGKLQMINSSIYSNGGLSINYPTSSEVITSNLTVNTDYSATTHSGEITKLTDLI